MANYKEHKRAGIISGLITGAISDAIFQIDDINKGRKEKFNWLEFAAVTSIGGVAGRIGGALPDIIEPSAGNPHHRKTAHSISVGTLSTVGLVALNKSKKVPSSVKSVANSFGAGYLSHLVLDSKTPFGLPIL